MTDYVSDLMAEVKTKNPAEPEFHQAVQEVADSLTLVLERNPEARDVRMLAMHAALPTRPPEITDRHAGFFHEHTREPVRDVPAEGGHHFRVRLPLRRK